MTPDQCRFLIVQFPTLRHYIIGCYNSGRISELLDFLFALETHEPGVIHG